MSGSWDPAEFPRLTNNDFTETSKATRKYNCIAWAAKETTKKWWPDPLGIGKWPPKIPKEVTIDAFVRAFGTIGYIRCDNRDLEDGFEKIVLYGTIDLAGKISPTHAAIQLPNGNWSSKIGDYEDIEHPALESLEGPTYGQVLACYLKRSRQP
jgi:hypothetical protein